MKKLLSILLILILFSLFFIRNSNFQELRVRVIPDSNSEEALKEKEEVKEIVILFLLDNYDKDLNTYKNNIKKNIDSLNTERISSKLEMHNFYHKTYNNMALLDEKVLTLVVRIGNASGDNWWGSIYPEFLGMESSECMNYKSYILECIEKRKKEND